VAADIGGVGFVSVYIPPRSGFDASYFNSIIPLLPSSFLILGDFNAHSTSFGCSISDRAGNGILDFIDRNNLGIVNDGSPTRLTPPNQNKSAIDLSICTNDIISNINWCVMSDPWSSDHYPILLSMIFEPVKYTKPSRKLYNTKKANWDLYRKLLEEKIPEIRSIVKSDSSIEFRYETMIDVVCSVAEKCMPVGSGKRTQTETLHGGTKNAQT
jgi:hypothetical protein